jgi:hypothetical protein
MNEVIDSGCAELRGILTEHMDTIDQSMQSMLAEHEGDKEFKYNVGLTLVITPRGADSAKVAAKISYAVRHTDETVGAVCDPNQMKMDLED